MSIAKAAEKAYKVWMQRRRKNPKITEAESAAKTKAKREKLDKKTDAIQEVFEMTGKKEDRSETRTKLKRQFEGIHDELMKSQRSKATHEKSKAIENRGGRFKQTGASNIITDMMKGGTGAATGTMGVAELNTEFKAAQKDGDSEKIKKLQAQLDKMNKGK